MPMTDKEVEAGLSLLHMMQPAAIAATPSHELAAAVAASSSNNSTVMQHDGVHDALLRAVASQADALALTLSPSHSNSIESDSNGSWTPRGFLKRNTQLTTLSRELTLDDLRMHFDRPIVDVAKAFGICTTFLKKICRRCGIKRWPHRQIRSLARTIEMLETAQATAVSTAERAKLAAQIAQLERKKRDVIANPDANGKLKRVKQCSQRSKTGSRTSGGSTRTTSASGSGSGDVDMDASDVDDDTLDTVMNDTVDGTRIASGDADAQATANAQAMQLLHMASSAHRLLPAVAVATSSAGPEIAEVTTMATRCDGAAAATIEAASASAVAPAATSDVLSRLAEAVATSASAPTAVPTPVDTATSPHSSSMLHSPTAGSSHLDGCTDAIEASSVSTGGHKISPSHRKLLVVDANSKMYVDATDGARRRSSSLEALQVASERLQRDDVGDSSSSRIEVSI